MRKIYMSLIALLVSSLTINAQVIYSQNFDTLTAGVKVAQTLGSTFWTTWTTTPGSTLDAVISNKQSFSSPNSIFDTIPNDLVFKAGGKTSGRYELSWKMFVPTSHIGYFNLLHSFAGSSSEWGFQAYVYNDSIFVDAGAATAAGAQFVRNAWHSVKFVIDIDDDFATFLLDGVEVISYQWSKGADGSGTLHKLDAIDFYGWTAADGGNPTPFVGTTSTGYYIDDLLYEQVTAPEPPMNLTAVVNGANIDVNWTAPSTTPDNYKLSRNGSVIFGTPSALTYTDVAPWPNTYNYMVRAGYGVSGYSHASNTASATITGGVTRNLVLMEGGTGTWCQYCPGAAMGLRDLIETNSKAAVAIEYHSGDTYECVDATQRIGYYTITAFPTVIADGKLRVAGGNATTSMYPYYLPNYNERIAVPALQNLNVNIAYAGMVDTYTATITVEETYPFLTSGLTLRTALTESNIHQVWGNQTECDFVCRGMFPDASGTNLDFSNSSTQTVTLNFSTAGYVKDNCEFVAFVQFDSTQEVTQVVKVDMSSITGIKELQGDKISIYPNPASDYMVLISNGKGTMTITDITGQVVYNSNVTNTTQYTDISKFNKGIYFVTIISDHKTFTQKLVVE